MGARGRVASSRVQWTECWPRVGNRAPNHASSPPSPGGDAPPSYSEVMGGVTGMAGLNNIRGGMQRVRESSNNQSKAEGFWKMCCGCCGSGG